jgi:hypothetical protein
VCVSNEQRRHKRQRKDGKKNKLTKPKKQGKNKTNTGNDPVKTKTYLIATNTTTSIVSGTQPMAGERS